MTQKKNSKKAIKSTKKKLPAKFSKSDCPDGVCPIKKKTAIKKSSKKSESKAKVTNTVKISPPPVPPKTSTKTGLFGRITQVLTKFNFYGKDS